MGEGRVTLQGPMSVDVLCRDMTDTFTSALQGLDNAVDRKRVLTGRSSGNTRKKKNKRYPLFPQSMTARKGFRCNWCLVQRSWGDRSSPCCDHAPFVCACCLKICCSPTDKNYRSLDMTLQQKIASCPHVCAHKMLTCACNKLTTNTNLLTCEYKMLTCVHKILMC